MIPLFSQKYKNIDKYAKNFFFEILVQTALTVGLFWTILKLTPKSALLSFTILRDSKRSRANFKIFTLICKYLPQTLVVPTYIAI